MAMIQSLMRFVRKSPHFDSNSNFNFVAKKLVHSISMENTNVSNSNSNSILINRKTASAFRCFNILSLITNPNTNDRSVVNIDLPFSNSSYTKIYGHSHGLVCCSNFYEENILLCNPATKEFYQLPPSLLLQTISHSHQSFVGFGYDPKSKDFKVVRFVEFRLPTCHLYTHRVEIYDLSKDRWREIENITHNNYRHSCALFDICHKGIYYFKAIKALNNSRRYIVISFDLSKERFREFSIPKGFKERDYVSLGFCSGSSIVQLLDPWEKDLETFNIWLIEKNESGGISWSKPLQINPVSTRRKPKLFVNSEELLLTEGRNEKVVSYNVNTKQFKSLSFEWDQNCSQYYVFEKSLLSVKGGCKHDLGDP